MKSNGLRGEAPKIVQIETRYVQTDAVNFRDVVQRLTGKNSSTAWIGRNATFGSSSEIYAKPQELGVIASDETKTSSMFINNLSFKDFDALFEFPPFEIMPRSCS